MTQAPRKLSAKALTTDVQAGLSDEDLIKKYQLSDQQLKTLFKKLVEIGGITEHDLNSRRRDSHDGITRKPITPNRSREQTGATDMQGSDGFQEQPKPLHQPSKDALGGVKRSLTKMWEKIPAGSEVSGHEPPPTPMETPEETLEKTKGVLVEAWQKIPRGSRPFYNYLIRPIIFIIAFPFLLIFAVTKPDHWENVRWRVYALILIFFPIGIYGAWKSQVLTRAEKGGLIILLIVLSIIGCFLPK
jgi:hypothetical protein